MEKFVSIQKVFLKCHNRIFVLGLGTLLLATPLLVGVSHLSLAQSANVLERYFTIFGLILLIPLYIPDLDRSSFAVIRAKKTTYLQILITRFSQVLFFTSLFLLTLLVMFHLGKSELHFVAFFLAEFGNILFLGGMANLILSLTLQPIIGLMVGIMYYVSNMMLPEKYFGLFYLFTLEKENWLSKIVLCSCGAVFFALSMWIAHLKKN